MKIPESISIPIQRQILRHYNLEVCPGAYEVMLVILAEENHGYYDKGIKNIISLTGFSRTKVFMCLSKLENHGYIRSRGKGQNGLSLYEIRSNNVAI
jgi:DNA-binding PadR family transcriptional regulator